LKISHINIDKKKNTKKEIAKASTNKIELLSREMNLNHEIIIFQDIDYNNSILKMRMMLKGGKIIKKYKEIELKINELSIKSKEKKIINFPFKSKLTLNYTLTNNKYTISLFIKDAQEKRPEKKQKSIFDQNDDEDENCKEESENSDEVKNDNDSNNDNNIVEENQENKKTDFRLRLSIFEKHGQPQKKNVNKPPSAIIKNNSKPITENKKDLKLEINKSENIKNNVNNNNINNKVGSTNNKTENIKNIFENNIKKFENKNSNIPKKEEIKKPENQNKNIFKEKINKFNTMNNINNHKTINKIENENKKKENINNNKTINKIENENKIKEENINNNKTINKIENENKIKENINNNKTIKKSENDNKIKEDNINNNKTIKKSENDNKIKEDNIKNFEKNNNEINKKNVKNVNNVNNIKNADNVNNVDNANNINNINKAENTKKLNINKNDINKKLEMNKSVVIEKSENLKKNEAISKNQKSKDDTDYKKQKSKEYNNVNLNSEFLLKSKTIDINDDYNLESFCKCFFICSFPYHDGKIMENSNRYRSLCNHAICCKLLAMEPEIIYKYPEDDINELELNNLSASICFPIGIKICYNQDRRSIYKSFSTHIINKQGQKYYMTIYHFYRQLDSMTYNKLYSDNPLKIYLRQFGDNTYRNKNEKEELERDLEECQELAFRENVFIPYAIALVSKYPYINQMRSCLNIIYKIFTNHNDILNNLNDNIKKSLLNKLLAYLIYGIPVPESNCEINFNMPLCLNKIKISSPYKNNIRNLENFNFCYILSRFCPENIIKIYQLMLFENKILFIDKDNNHLSTTIDSFINILYPIDWANTVIPIMSDQMTRYLQTFLPFINGISEDLLLNSAQKALKEAEEGVFQIYILNDLIKYSKPNYEEDVLSSLPKLPNEIYKKLYSELSDLSEAYKLLNEKEKEKYAENVNNIVKNIFLETVCIMLYCLMDYVLNNVKDYNGFNIRTLVKIYGQEDANFYKELTETQIFQNFIKNFIQRKKDYSLFICMLKNITEKYIVSQVKSKFTWRKTIRKLNRRDILQIPIIFKIPLHLLNKEDNAIHNYYIEKKEWIDINNTLSKNNISLSNDIIQESDRKALTINPIKNELNPPNNKMEIFVLPNNKDNKDENLISRRTTYINEDSHMFDKLLNLNYVKANEFMVEESDLSKNEQNKMKKTFKEALTSLLKNKPIIIDEYLNIVYYTFGREILCKLLYQKGFKVVKKLNEECFNSLKQLLINAFVSLNNVEESQNILEFSVKITSSAFCFCKEKSQNILLIDELRDHLGKEYSYWNKKSFWNTWQHLENYFTINEYAIFCQVIVHEFLNKFLRLKLDKDFIENYVISLLAEKMILLEHTLNLDKNVIKENQTLFVEHRTKVMEIISNTEY